MLKTSLKIKLFFLTVTKAFRLKKWKIIIKLGLSYMIAIIVCMLLVNTFYYFRVINYMDSKTMQFLRYSIIQAKENIEYKVEVYNRFQDSIYLNTVFQDMLHTQYNDIIEQRQAQAAIGGYLNFLRHGYTDIVDFRLYVTNPTIPDYNNDNNYVGAIDEIALEDWYKKSQDKYDEIIWFLDSAIQPGDRGTQVDMNQAEGITAGIDAREYRIVSLVRKLRHISSNSMIGVMRADLTISSLFSGLDTVADKGAGWFAVTDDKKNLIYSNNTSIKEDIKYSVHQRLFKINEFVNGDTIDIGGQKYIILSEALKDLKWHLIYITPLDMSQTDVKSFQIAMVAAVLAITLLFLIISWVLASTFTKKVRMLSKSMKQIQEGNFDVQINSKGADEIDELISGFNIMAGRLKVLVEEVLTVKVKEKELEMKALQAQINPHFLYNTLASISWLGLKVKSNDITNMSNSLAKFYRLSLNKGSNIIKVRDEIEQVRAYIGIQCIRFQNNIHTSYDIEDAVLELDTVRLIIQPFIENAILHGMWDEKRSLNLRLAVKKEGDKLTWTIIDDGIGITPGKLKNIVNQDGNDNHGYGIVNVDKRIKLYFGENYGVSIWSRPGIGTVVTINTGVILS